MDESSSEEIVQKMDHKPYSTKLKPCLDVSNNSQSQNEEDDIYFSTNCLIKMKTEIKPSSHFVKKNYSIRMIVISKKIYLHQIVRKKPT